MKNLFYKEMKLAMHPIVWVFLLVFPLMILIPNYPGFVGFIYVCSAYPILFLGANKGQQSNDIYFSCLLPVKKTDIVKARMMTILFLQIVSLVITCALSPIGNMVKESIVSDPITPEEAEMLSGIGFGFKGTLAMCAFSIVSFAIYDLIFLPLFYRNGRSVVLPTLLGVFAFLIIEFVFCMILPLGIPAYKSFFEDNIVVSILAFVLSILISAALHFLTYKASSNLFEKVDL